MLSALKNFTSRLNIDWILLGSVLLISAAGLVTMNSFTADNTFFDRQMLWLGVSLAAFFALSFFDYRFLRRTGVIVSLFAAAVLLLVILLLIGEVTKGVQSWFTIGPIAFQPTDPAKIVLILLLAKYFARRHVEIAHIRHILLSGFYAFVIFVLIFLQPDPGSASIVFLIWLGMVLVSGISKKHLLLVFLTGLIAFGGLWMFVFEPYQKDRIVTFIHPYTDLQGAGYNAYQSTVAVGSGQILGKGIGYGTQSKLQFLPEYETDFIFAAFAEEWGFVGVVVLFGLYAIVIWRVLANAYNGATNFEILYGIGVSVFFMSHFLINVGMNVGLLPVTGTTLPFMSYGGSHLLTEFTALGILMGMRSYARTTHKEKLALNELGEV